MPTQLHLEFFQDGYRRIPGGLYIISTPESKNTCPNKAKVPLGSVVPVGISEKE